MQDKGTKRKDGKVDHVCKMLSGAVSRLDGHWRAMRRFLANEEGPTAVEYAVMLALIVIVCLSAITTLGTNAKSTFLKIGSSIGS